MRAKEREYRENFIIDRGLLFKSQTRHEMMKSTSISPEQSPRKSSDPNQIDTTDGKKKKTNFSCFCRLFWNVFGMADKKKSVFFVPEEIQVREEFSKYSHYFSKEEFEKFVKILGKERYFIIKQLYWAMVCCHDSWVKILMFWFLGGSKTRIPYF